MTWIGQGRRADASRRALALTMFVATGALAGCDGLLDVELPGSITEDALYDPSQAAVLVTSAIADIECGYSDFLATNGSGAEETFVRVTGWWGGSHEFDDQPNTTDCNTSNTSYGWWTPMHKGRFLAEGAYTRILDWDVNNKEQLLAQAAIYAGLSYDLFGEYFCEMAFDKGPLLSPDQTLAVAEDYLTKALGHIQTTGDFAIPAGIASSAEQMALVLRTRVRWARDDFAGATADAQRVNQGFVAYATREGTGVRQRWNKVVGGNNDNPFISLAGPVNWWSGPGGWPAVIPFTGFRNLAILPDGRAVTNDRYPITLASAGAVADVRVPAQDRNTVVNGYPFWTQQKYDDAGDDIPLANWQEVWLILAEIENEAGNGQAAIDLVNEIRDFHDLPTVTYLSPANASGINDLIIEERRRSLFLEGRYWSTKLRENLWFPRGVDETPYPYSYQNGIRMVMPDAEFDLNPNLEPSQQGSLCGVQAPA
jgi:starch-binding outer membrane protein, SusD/RagB family